MTNPPAGRYGPEPTTRLRVWCIAGLVALVLAAAAVLTWVAIGQFGSKVSWQDAGYHVTDATSIQVTFQVTKPAGATVTCQVEALSQSFAQVGIQAVTVGPGTTSTETVSVTVPTSERAVTGTVDSCSLAG